MLRDQAIRWSSRLLPWLKWIAAFIAAFVGACLKADQTSFAQWPIVFSALTWVQVHAWETLPLSTFIAGGAQWFQSRIGSKHQWDTIQVMLDHFREQIFDKGQTKDDPKYFHRVTMFKHRYWRLCIRRWPLGGWLVPVSRSDVATKTNIKCFKASLNDPTHAEGIAGKAFVNQRELRANDLPNLQVQRANDADVKLYAERTFMAEKIVRKSPPVSRSIVAIPFEVNGKPWGVIVLDSQNPREIKYPEGVYGVIAKVCNTLLR
jgi:hypothetical protein